MIADRDSVAVVRAWLAAPVSLDDDGLFAVLEQLPNTPQRRSGWTWRPAEARSDLRRVGGALFGALRVIAVSLVVLLAALAPGLSIIGSRPLPRTDPGMVIRATTAWSFPPPVTACTGNEARAVETWPLPATSAPSTRPGNGLIAQYSETLTLLDPADGTVTRTSGLGGGANGEGWSPDGRWLQVGREMSGCNDVHLVSSDGMRLVDIRDAWEAAWSPDGRWLAVGNASDETPTHSAIDVLALNDAGTVTQRHRIWVGTDANLQRLIWGPRGDLAWEFITGPNNDARLDVLHPGVIAPLEMDLRDDYLSTPTWTRDGGSIVALSNGSPLLLRRVDAATLQLTTTQPPLAAAPFQWNVGFTLVSTDDGRVIFPARASVRPNGQPVPAVNLFSVALDGSDPRNLTGFSDQSGGAEDPVLSPDGTVMAFYGNRVDVGSDLQSGTWLMGVDGSDPHWASSEAGHLSWQPIP